MPLVSCICKGCGITFKIEARRARKGEGQYHSLGCFNNQPFTDERRQHISQGMTGKGKRQRDSKA